MAGFTRILAAATRPTAGSDPTKTGLRKCGEVVWVSDEAVDELLVIFILRGQRRSMLRLYDSPPCIRAIRPLANGEQYNKEFLSA